MAYWLMKSEPGSWSWTQQVKAGAKGEAWTGVRNFQAKSNLMKMRRGDRAFFYHSGEDKAVVGIVEVARDAALRDRPDVYGEYLTLDLLALDPEQERHLRSLHADVLQCVAPVGDSGGQLPEMAGSRNP